MVSIIFAIIEAFLLHFTIALFYDKKYGSIVSFMSLVLLILFNIFIVIYSPQYKLFICMGAYLCYSLAFNARAGYRAFMVMIYMTLITISEFIVMGMLNIVMPDKWSMYKMPAMFAAYIIYFGLVFTFYKFFKINFKRMPYKYIIAITVTVLLFFLSLEMMSGVVFTSTKEIRLYFSVIGIVLFMAIIILAYIFSSLCGYYNLYIESREETMVSNMIKSYYEGIEKNNEEMRKLAHDYKNQILTLKALINDSQAESYINSISEKLDNPVIKYTGNRIADIVINQKVKIAAEKNIDIKILGYIGENNISPYDICSLFSNIIDNAIEASENADEKRVVFKLDNKGDYLYVHCENTFRYKPVKVNNHFVSTKENKGHGMGLKIIEDIVNRYNGHIDIKCSEDIFEIDILLTKFMGGKV